MATSKSIPGLGKRTMAMVALAAERGINISFYRSKKDMLRSASGHGVYWRICAKSAHQAIKNVLERYESIWGQQRFPVEMYLDDGVWWAVVGDPKSM